MTSQIRKFQLLISLSLVTLILFASCSSSTMITSVPPGADLYVDGMPVGKTPYTHTDSKIISSTTSVRMEKEGYEPFIYDITKDEEVNLVPAVAGFFFLIPWLWAMKYKSVHTWKLIPKEGDVVPEEESISPNREIKPNPTDSTEAKAEKLRELKSLLDEGILTDEEYQKEKQKILDSE